MYSIYSFGFDLTDFYLEHREVDAAPLSFLTGAGCTLLSLLGWKVGRRAFQIKAGRAYRQILRTAWNSEEVRAKLGEDVRAKTIARMQRYGRNHAFERAPAAAATSSLSSSSSASASSSTSAAAAAAAGPSGLCAANFRLVSFLPMGLAHRGEKDGWGRWWVSRRLQFLVGLHGSRGSAVLAAEVEQPIRAELDTTNLLVLDIIDQGQQVVLTKHAQPSKTKQDFLDRTDQHKGITTGTELLSKKVTRT